MKKKLSIALGVIVIIIALSVTFILMTRQARDWNFIQSVGGIKTEKPLETEDGYYLPVVCNVSGVDSVTIKSSTLNSALFVLKTKTHIKENRIYLTVFTGYSIVGKNDCKCKAVKIGTLKYGSYEIYYKDKDSTEHRIGKFTVE